MPPPPPPLSQLGFRHWKRSIAVETLQRLSAEAVEVVVIWNFRENNYWPFSVTLSC